MTRILLLIACLALTGCDAAINLAVNAVGSTAWNAITK